MASLDVAKALLSAAVRAAVQAGAPMRTVAAVATSTAEANEWFLVPLLGAHVTPKRSKVQTTGEPGPSPDVVLRMSRSAKRRGKRRLRW